MNENAPTLDQQMIAEVGMPHGNSLFSKENRRKPVKSSPDFERIKAIPRRQIIQRDDGVFIKTDKGEKKIPDFTPLFRTAKGTLDLWPLQNAALAEIASAAGGFFPLSVGVGKTLISLLAHEAAFGPVEVNGRPGPGSRFRTVLLVKPQLRTQLITQDIPFYKKHFNIPLNNINILAYTDLSGAKGSHALETLKPDQIIADEAHSLRHSTSARTRRFLAYMKKHANTRFIALSGTMTKRSIRDYAHLTQHSLKGNTPLPLSFYELQEWSEALDVVEGDGEPKPAGVLREFCNAPDEDVRVGFRRRLIETPGVVSSEGGSVDIPMTLRARPVTVPKIVEDKIAEVYRTWQIGEEELADGMAIARVVRQLATGFYYEWKWPDGVRDVEWIMARRAWMKALRDFLGGIHRPGLDSPFLVENAVREKRLKGTAANDLYHAYGPWAAIRDRTSPETVPKWIDPFVVRDAIIWGRDKIKRGENGLIFYENEALGACISRVSGWPQFGAGTSASSVTPQQHPVTVCSIQAQGTGKNLQAWSSMLVCSPPANGVAWEQLLGRVSRPGQKAKHLVVDMYMHCEAFTKAFDKAIADAEYMKATQGQDQKILLARLENITVHRETPNEDIAAALSDDEDDKEN